MSPARFRHCGKNNKQQLTASSSAGSRDSELTNHGVQQAKRLGRHLHGAGLVFTHIFASDLRRASKTAGLVRKAQQPPEHDDDADVKERSSSAPAVLQLPQLREQDFGSLEGVSFIRDAKLGREAILAANRDKHAKGNPRFVEVESLAAVQVRTDAFLDEHLLPLVWASTVEQPLTVLLVSHGITLSVLWKCLLLRLPKSSVVLSPEALEHRKEGVELERAGRWDNTGYLEMEFNRPVAIVPPPPASSSDVDGQSVDAAVVQPAKAPSASTIVPATDFQGWTMTVKAMNGQAHLVGLKRTRGGVGSAKHDDKQRSLFSFFTPPKKKVKR